MSVNTLAALNDIRQYIATHREVVKMIMLTPQQSQVFSYVRKQRLPVCSNKITKKFGLSAQHTCMIMEALHRKGYVDRISQPQESGGYEYEYSSQID